MGLNAAGVMEVEHVSSPVPHPLLRVPKEEPGFGGCLSVGRMLQVSPLELPFGEVFITAKFIAHLHTRSSGIRTQTHYPNGLSEIGGLFIVFNSDKGLCR